jgi:phenol 2-monooxygenase
MVLHQGYLEALMIDTIRKKSGTKVERGVISISIQLDESQIEDPSAYPVTVQLKHLKEDEMEYS